MNPTSAVGKRVLVTGGAGYVGAVVAEALVAAGAERLVVLDDLSNGHARAVVPPAQLVRGDIGDRRLVHELCGDERLGLVAHLAGSSIIEESMRDPGRYFRDNLSKSIALADALVAAGVRGLVFSSSAAVYGDAAESPIAELTPAAPSSVYGETKLAFENALRWYASAHDLRSISLRYFNAAGASARNGEDHRLETHLIPIVLEVARGRRPHLTIHGDRWSTPDGTCVRDFVHVSDLAQANLLALGALDRQPHRVYNVGCGRGWSVRQVIDAAERLTLRAIPTRVGPPQPGTPARLVANCERIRSELGWQPERRDLSAMLADAWAWLEKR